MVGDDGHPGGDLAHASLSSPTRGPGWPAGSRQDPRRRRPPPRGLRLDDRPVRGSTPWPPAVQRRSRVAAATAAHRLHHRPLELDHSRFSDRPVHLVLPAREKTLSRLRPRLLELCATTMSSIFVGDRVEHLRRPLSAARGASRQRAWSSIGHVPAPDGDHEWSPGRPYLSGSRLLCLGHPRGRLATVDITMTNRRRHLHLERVPCPILDASGCSRTGTTARSYPHRGSFSPPDEPLASAGQSGATTFSGRVRTPLTYQARDHRAGRRSGPLLPVCAGHR